MSLNPRSRIDWRRFLQAVAVMVGALGGAYVMTLGLQLVSRRFGSDFAILSFTLVVVLVTALAVSWRKPS